MIEILSNICLETTNRAGTKNFVSIQLVETWDLIWIEAQYVRNCVYAKSSLWLDGFISWGYTISKPNIKRNFQSPLQRFTMTHSKCEFASDKITIYNIFSCHSCIWGQFYLNFPPSGWFSNWNISKIWTLNLGPQKTWIFTFAISFYLTLWFHALLWTIK